MTRSAWLLSLSLLSATACARGTGAGTEPPGGNKDTAQRIYMVAEERYAAGAYDEAAALMRHALLQLPATAEHDHLRHELVLRMAHTQLRDHAATGQAAPLYDAQQMLTRYLERHEELFGDGAKARAERGEAYELLHLVEQRIEPMSIDLGDEPATDEQVVVAEVAAGIEAYEPPALALEAAASAPASTSSPALEEKAPAAERHLDADGNEVREVVVHQRRLASLDDPRVKQRLRSPFSTGWLGGVLSGYGVTKMRDARPLVRGQSRLASDGDLAQHALARRAGQSLLREARQDLRDCYASAYARRPVDALDSAVEASIHPDGSVSHVRIVEGGLVDGYGDACVIEALEGTTVAPLDEAAEPVRVQVALRFLYEGALSINELTGEQVHEGGIMLSPPAPRHQGLPPIENFAQRDPNEPSTMRRRSKRY